MSWFKLKLYNYNTNTLIVNLKCVEFKATRGRMALEMIQCGRWWPKIIITSLFLCGRMVINVLEKNWT